MDKKGKVDQRVSEAFKKCNWKNKMVDIRFGNQRPYDEGSNTEVCSGC